MRRDGIIIAEKLARYVAAAGGTAYYVGGFVRDEIMGIKGSDVDIEVHGISSEQLENILSSIGKLNAVGKAFGIYVLGDVDISIPRCERATGNGHRAFEVEVDPQLGIENAVRRRDFTMNGLMKNVLTGELTDCCGGVSDIENKIIRHINDSSFAEDPLRVLRAAQFSARFGFDIAEETKELCRGMDIGCLARERIISEMKKALIMALRPSVFFEQLREMNQLEQWFGELAALIGTEQNPEFHAEGDAWQHTMLVLDAAAKMKNVKHPFWFMLAALTHDFGKAVCTEKINGVIHSYRHETLGIPQVENFLCRLTDERKLIRYVLNMTELHMRPNVLAHANSAIKSSNRMFDLAVEPFDLICLAAADARGQISSVASGEKELRWLMERYELYKEYMSRPYVTGSDLIAAGLQPDKRFSQILAHAHKLRLAGIDKSTALKQSLSYAKSVLH